MRREEQEPDVHAAGSAAQASAQTAAQVANANGGAQEDVKIDRIRDLLFGGHMKQVNDQFTKLGEHFQKETATLRKELFDRCDAIERYVKDEVASLNKRLTAEQSTRSDMAGKFAREAKDIGDTFERKTEQLAMQAEENHRELRESLLEQSKALAEDIRQRYTDISAQLEDKLQSLQDAKTDRAALASFFGEIAMRLNQDGLPSELGGK